MSDAAPWSSTHDMFVFSSTSFDGEQPLQGGCHSGEPAAFLGQDITGGSANRQFILEHDRTSILEAFGRYVTLQDGGAKLPPSRSGQKIEEDAQGDRFVHCPEPHEKDQRREPEDDRGGPEVGVAAGDCCRGNTRGVGEESGCKCNER